MKNCLITAILIFILNSITVNAQVTFYKTYGIAATNGSVNNEVTLILTNDSNYAIAGTTISDSGNFFLMKLDPAGDTLWTKEYGGVSDDVLYGAIQTSDNGFLLAGYTRSFTIGESDGYLVKTDAAGNIQWSKHYGGIDWDLFTSLFEYNEKGFIICGNTWSYGMGSSDIYLMRLDYSGNIIWTRTLGGNGWDNAAFMQETEDGGIIITGSSSSFTPNTQMIYLVKTDSVGNPLWAYHFGDSLSKDEALCVKECYDHGFIVTGFTNSFGAGMQDAFLLKTNANGALQWMKTYGGTDEEFGYDVDQTSDSGFVVAGRTRSFPFTFNSRYIYLIKTNQVGDTSWTRTYFADEACGYSVVENNLKEYYVAVSSHNIVLLKTDSTGNSGCHFYNTGTLISTVTPLIDTGIVASNGGSAAVAATIQKGNPSAFNTLCFSTGVNEISSGKQLKINPNPADDRCTIEVNDAKTYMIKIIDLSGHVLKNFNYNFENNILDTSDFPEGFYFVRIESENKNSSVSKLLVKHGK